MPRFGVCLLVLVSSGPLGAQTAAMAQAASVAFHSQKDTLPLNNRQRRDADQLDQQAQHEIQAGRLGEALRRYAHATAVLRDAAWTPALEFAASLQGRIDHAMLDPGKPVTLALAALYPCNGKSVVSVFLVSAAKGGPAERELGSGAAVESTSLPFTMRVTIPETAPGTYYLELRLALSDTPEALRELYVKAFPVHIERLSEDAQTLRERLAKLPRRDSPALATAAFALQFYERTDRGEEGVRRFGRYPFREQFAAVNAILDAIDAGRDPFRATNHGDFHRAYRSPVDGTLQPYRIFIPDRYDGARPVPLLIALHGAGGDENDFFDDFPAAPLQPEAQRHGFIVVCPKGRDPHSGYRGAAEQDVFDVLTEVRREYRIDPSRIYLMGHSMGAYATWRLATEHPDLFAALGPISGGGDPGDMVKIRHIPQYIVHGANDQTVPVAQSRAMAEAARQAHAEVVYVEVPGAGHYDAAIGQFGPMLDFFAQQAQRVQ
jgi:pimeloyl-ACP methyl ester carboxylesterase